MIDNVFTRAGYSADEAAEIEAQGWKILGVEANYAGKSYSDQVYALGAFFLYMQDSSISIGHTPTGGGFTNIVGAFLSLRDAVSAAGAIAAQRNDWFLTVDEMRAEGGADLSRKIQNAVLDLGLRRIPPELFGSRDFPDDEKSSLTNGFTAQGAPE